MMLSTVPAARVVGHAHREDRREPKNLQEVRCTLVFPERSFHTSKRKISCGEADARDLGRGKEKRKLSRSR